MRYPFSQKNLEKKSYIHQSIFTNCISKFFNKISLQKRTFEDLNSSITSTYFEMKRFVERRYYKNLKKYVVEPKNFTNCLIKLPINYNNTEIFRNKQVVKRVLPFIKKKDNFYKLDCGKLHGINKNSRIAIFNVNKPFSKSNQIAVANVIENKLKINTCFIDVYKKIPNSLISDCKFILCEEEDYLDVLSRSVNLYKQIRVGENKLTYQLEKDITKYINLLDSNTHQFKEEELDSKFYITINENKKEIPMVK